MSRFSIGKYKVSGARIIAYFFLTFLVLIINYPFLWMFFTSLKARQEVFLIPSHLVPKKLMWGNYAEAWSMAPWAAYIKNSFVVAVIPIFGQIFFGSLAAYAFTRPFKGSKIIFTLFLGTMMIPGQATLIPNYVIFKTLRWLNSYYALVVPFLTGAFAIFLLRQFFLSVPKDYEDAATIDGCGAFYYLFRILIPLSSAALVTVALLTFNDRWNDYLYSLIMVTKDNMRTVQVGMAVFQGEGGTMWHLLMAASTFITIPVIVLFLFVQRRFIDGVMMSGIKG
jgi:multiple sugar transport system permease protein